MKIVFKVVIWIVLCAVIFGTTILIDNYIPDAYIIWLIICLVTGYLMKYVVDDWADKLFGW